MRLRDAEGAVLAMGDREEVSSAVLNRMDMGSGVVTATLELPRALFYSTVSERCGLEIRDDGDLIDQLTQMAAMKRSYEKVEEALHQVEATGYGIVMPDPQEMTLEEPEIVKQGGRYGVRLKASAPSIHIERNKKKYRSGEQTEWANVSGRMVCPDMKSGGDTVEWYLLRFCGKAADYATRFNWLTRSMNSFISSM